MQNALPSPINDIGPTNGISFVPGHTTSGSLRPANPLDGDGGSLSLVHLYRVLLTRWWLILVVTIICFIANMLYTLKIVPIYTATALVMIEPHRANIANVNDVYSDASFGGAGYYNTQIGLMKSRRIAIIAAGRLGMPTTDGKAMAHSKNGLTDMILSSTSVRLSRDSRLIEVVGTSVNPEYAASAPNALVEAYIEDTRQRTHGVSDLGLKQLRERAADMEPKVQAAENELREWESKHGIGLGESAGPNAQLDDLKQKLNGLRVERQKLEAMKKLLAGRSNADLVDPNVKINAMLEQLRVDLLKTEVRWRDLRARYTEDHPVMAPVKEQLEFLRKEIETELGYQRERTEIELKSALEQEALLAAVVREQEQAVSDLHLKRSQLTMLTQKASSLRTAYEGVLKRIDQLDLSQTTGREEDNIYFLERAVTPTMPFHPNVPKQMWNGLAIGIVLGIVLVLLLEFLDSSIKSKEEVERVLGLPVLGFVPRIPKTTRVKVGDEFLKISAEQVALYDANSHVAESFRSLRTGFDFSLPPDHQRTILVTSSTPGDGKSLVACNLAASLARRGDRVLLVDADMRRPRQAKIMSLANEIGLSTVLEAGIDDSSFDAIASSLVPNLDVLSAGPTPSNPAELLGSEAMTVFISRATSRYSWVVFDAPPMTVVTDPAVLMRQLPHVLFVVRAFHTPRDQAKSAAEMLRGSPARSIGVVLNTVDVPKAYGKSADYGTYYKYYRKYQSSNRHLNGGASAPRRSVLLSAAVEITPPAGPEPLGDEWIALSQAAILMMRTTTAVACLAGEEAWPVRTGLGPKGNAEPHYPIERVRDHLVS